MAYASIEDTRAFCGLTTSEISDDQLGKCISGASKCVDSMKWLNLDSDQKDIAVRALASHLALLNTAGVASANPSSISLGDLKAGRTSQLAAKAKISTKFWDLFMKIISWGSYADDLFIRTNK